MIKYNNELNYTETNLQDIRLYLIQVERFNSLTKKNTTKKQITNEQSSTLNNQKVKLYIITINIIAKINTFASIDKIIELETTIVIKLFNKKNAITSLLMLRCYLEI